MAAPRTIDWERLEPDWRAGIKSVPQMVAEYEEATGKTVSKSAINKHFKDFGIPRDLAAKIKAKADAIVSASMVSGKVSTDTNATDVEIINKAATDIAIIQLAHRQDIRRNRELANKLMSELEAQTGNLELFHQLSELMQSNDKDAVGKLDDMYRRVIALPSRVDTAKKLAETLKVLIGLEREAFNIDGNKSPGLTLDDFLDAIANA